jgi:hypothetical protein
MVYITRQVSVSFVPGLDIGQITIGCPAGYLVAGSALSPGAIVPVAEAAGRNLVIFAGYNPSETTVYSYYAHVHCVESSGYSIARSATGSREQMERVAREAVDAVARTRSK